MDAAAVSCFGRLSCSGEAASSGEHEETCCSAQLSYLTDAGVCCNCSEGQTLFASVNLLYGYIAFSDILNWNSCIKVHCRLTTPAD